MHESPERGEVVGGKYRVVRQLGRGGMAIVFEAENVATGKRVALKWMPPEVSADNGAGERLLREAQMAARVRHPNVIDIYDADRHGDDLFLVMEYLEGESLRALLERGGTPPAELLTLLIGAMRGVAAAHKEGVIHRDIKPENIFLVRAQEDGGLTPKVLDFGISATLDAHPLRMNTTGLTFGTPIYMSYEQLSGEREVDARTDVYSFGVILYEALTGQVPFEADTFPSLIVKIATTPPTRLRKHRPDLPYALERVVLGALSKDRARRTASLDALIAALEPCVVDLALRVAPPAPLLASDRPRRATARLTASLRTSMLVRVVQRELHRRSTQVLGAVGLVGVLAALILQWGGAHPDALRSRAARELARAETRAETQAAHPRPPDSARTTRDMVDAGVTPDPLATPPDAGRDGVTATSTRPAWPNRRARPRAVVPTPPAAARQDPSMPDQADAGLRRVRHRVDPPRLDEF